MEKKRNCIIIKKYGNREIGSIELEDSIVRTIESSIGICLKLLEERIQLGIRRFCDIARN